MHSTSQHHRYAFLLAILCASAFSQTFNYTSFQVPGSSHTAALGLNNSGEIVGSFVSNGQQAGFFYSAGTFPPLPSPPPLFTTAPGTTHLELIVSCSTP